MKIIVLFTFIALLLGGCGQSHYWYQSGNTLRQAEADCTECYQQAINETAAARFDAIRRSQITNTPFLSEAENKFDDDFLSIRFTGCMNAKGYRRVAGESLPPSLRKKTPDLPPCSAISQYDYRIAGR